MSKEMSKYRIVCLAAESGDRYLIVRNLDSGESNIYKNKLVNDEEGAFSGDNVIDTNLIPLSVEDLGLTNPAVAKYIEVENVDEEDVERSPSVDHSYSSALIDEKFLSSMDHGMVELPNVDESLILKEYRMLDGVRAEGKYVTPRIVNRFAYDVESDDPNFVLRGAVVRFIIPYRGKIDPEMAYIFPSLVEGPMPKRPKPVEKPKPASIPKTPVGNLRAREIVRNARVDVKPEDAPIAKSTRGLHGPAKWQRFWADMEEIEKKNDQ
ncbi:MAG: hypothetical protein V3V26_01165 [Candidatus Aenigmarchaeota archaeon]